MRYDEDRYGGGGDDYVRIRPRLTLAQITQVQAGLAESLGEEVTEPQLTANQNNFPLAPGFALHRFTTDGVARTITGFAGGAPGRVKFFCNAGGGANITLNNQDAASSAENRIITGTGGNVAITPDQLVYLIYDNTSQRWRLRT